MVERRERVGEGEKRKKGRGERQHFFFDFSPLLCNLEVPGDSIPFFQRKPCQGGTPVTVSRQIKTPIDAEPVSNIR